VKQYGNDIRFYEKIFETVTLSNFLMGDNSRTWRASFDWIMSLDGMAGIIEGKYANGHRFTRAPTTEWERNFHDEIDYGLKEYRV
jgi:hypothetical protein